MSGFVRACATCGKPIARQFGRGRPRRYCSEECSRENTRSHYESKIRESTCQDCGVNIVRRGGGPMKKRCGDCRKEYRRNRDNARKRRVDRHRRQHDHEWAEKERARVVARGQARIARKRGSVRAKCTDGLCYLCLVPIDFDGEWHVDHVYPRSKGGSDELVNLAATHAACNLKKHDKIIEGAVAA